MAHKEVSPFKGILISVYGAAAALTEHTILQEKNLKVIVGTLHFNKIKPTKRGTI